MAISNINSSTELKSNSNHISTTDVKNVVDTVQERHLQGPIHKYRLVNFLYKPPFGLPRNINPTFLRDISRSIYSYSIINRIVDEIVTSKWDIVPKEGVEMTKELEVKRVAMREFFNNPNSMNISFEEFTRQLLMDTIVLESGIIVKVFNQFGEMVEMKAADGATFTKNPDIYNTFNDREDVILDSFQPNFQEPTSEEAQKQVTNGILRQFRTQYNDRAAYFQYSNFSTASAPIPFGKKEVVWLMKNPMPGGVYTYGSPVQASVETILSLIFGGKYNLDYFLNGNTPEGIIKVAGADSEVLNSVKEKLKNKMEVTDNEYGLSRRIGHNLPAVSAENVEFIPINFTSKDLEIITQGKWFMRLLWMMFGLSPDEMGDTETSNRATGQQQTSNALRKAYRPYMNLLEYNYTRNILTEFEDGNLFEFKFDDSNLDVTKQELDIAEQEIRMGIKTPEMIAEEMGIDIVRLEKSKTETETNENDNEEDNSDSPTEDNNSNNDSEEVKSYESKRVYQQGLKWYVGDKDGKQILGIYDSEEEAMAYYNSLMEEDKTEEMKPIDEDLEKKVKQMDLEDVVKIVMKTMEMNSQESKSEYEDKACNVELKGDDKSKPTTLPDKSATEIVMDEFEKEYTNMVKDIINKAKK